MRIDANKLLKLLAQAQRLEEFEASIARAVEVPADVSSIIDFFEIPTGDFFNIEPTKALAYFKAKGLRETFAWQDMLGDAHDHAFTVAKMMDVDLLGQMRASMESALANGTPFKEWADSITPTLQSAGWWGKKTVLDPLTGETVVAKLGSPHRLETIFRTNMQTAYAAGAWQEIVDQARDAPYLMYDAVDDFRTREQHRAWDRTVLPVASPWWKTHYPPNGWNCRCGVIQLSAAEVDRLGLDVSEVPNDGTYTWTNPRTGTEMQIPNGLDPGFDKNSGMSFAADMKQLLDNKIDALPSSMRDAARRAKAEMAKAGPDLQASQKKALTELGKKKSAAAKAFSALQARAAAAAIESDAQKTLDAIAAGRNATIRSVGARYKVEAFRQLSRSDSWLELKPSERLDQVETLAAALIAEVELAAKNAKESTASGTSLMIFDGIDQIVLPTQAEVDAAIAWMRQRGYATWPDGRALDAVIITKAKSR